MPGYLSGRAGQCRTEQQKHRWLHKSKGEELEGDHTTGYSCESDTDSAEENNINDDIIKRVEGLWLD
ncbi:hypothetical protein HYALB_00013336 [Hymenoscyphus albidus]|uniref:Uncharacterized protein n=1 Tax=Hymenoscyphus albidus TaxID=595503 RepID=A0A9N9Q428_9HELO|nr:hypothetical protein HYALB_00013336 [Hymenoscyphus albidus]